MIVDDEQGCEDEAVVRHAGCVDYPHVADSGRIGHYDDVEQVSSTSRLFDELLRPQFTSTSSSLSLLCPLAPGQLKSPHTLSLAELSTTA